MSLKTYTGSCHCGLARFRAQIDLSAGTGRCNCSYCSKTRAWGTTIKPDAFELLAGEDALSDYQFNTKSGHHRFCRTCGVHVYAHGYVEQIGGAFVSINIACLEDVPDDELAALPIKYSDGRADAWWNAPRVTAHL